MVSEAEKTTVLKDIDFKAQKYPRSLADATHLLIEEQGHFIPTYMPGERINELEAQARTVEAREKMRKEIDAFRGQVRGMVRHMAIEWRSAYATGSLLSEDRTTIDPAITKPEDPKFSFAFHPKTFDLGLTGRLLEDDAGTEKNFSQWHQYSTIISFGICV